MGGGGSSFHLFCSNACLPPPPLRRRSSCGALTSPPALPWPYTYFFTTGGMVSLCCGSAPLMAQPDWATMPWGLSCESMAISSGADCNRQLCVIAGAGGLWGERVRLRKGGGRMVWGGGGGVT